MVKYNGIPIEPLFSYKLLVGSVLTNA